METRLENSASASREHAIDVDPLPEKRNQSDTSTGAGSSSCSEKNMSQNYTSTGSDPSSCSVQDNQNKRNPSLHLLNERNKKQHKLCLDLRNAALEGDIDEALRLFENNSSLRLLSAAITEGKETVLHIAAGAKQAGFVEKMIDLMGSTDELKLQNQKGNTAFCFAVMAGSKPIVEKMLEKEPSLPEIRGGEGLTPLNLAALFGQEEMALFLYQIYYKGKLTVADQKETFFVSIDTTLYELALELLQDDDKNELAVAYYLHGNVELTPLHRLAQTPFHLLDQTCKSVKTNLSNQALQLVERIWEKIFEKEGTQVWNYFCEHKDLLFDAAHLGNFKFLAKLIHLYPDLVHQMDSNNRTIFHIAIMHRHDNLFSLIHKIGFNKQLIATYLDKDKNSLLHLAAEYPNPRPVSIVPGAALEMQRELRIFQGVELLVMPSFRELKNRNGETPQELFTRTHADLLKKGEEWMRETAGQCILVTTIIATVVFAAAFGVPGGNDDKEGLPILRRSIAFHIFAVADIMALSSSSISMLMFLSILTSRYAENDFHRALPLKLVVGLLTLFISIATMMIAFISTFFITYKHPRSTVIPILGTIFVFLSVYVFGSSQYGLLRDIIFHSSFRFKLSSSR